jgi:hypothetical protein
MPRRPGIRAVTAIRLRRGRATNQQPRRSWTPNRHVNGGLPVMTLADYLTDAGTDTARQLDRLTQQTTDAAVSAVSAAHNAELSAVRGWSL